MNVQGEEEDRTRNVVGDELASMTPDEQQQQANVGQADEDAVDAVSGPPGGGPPPAAPQMPGGELTPDQLALAATGERPVGPLDQVDQTLADNPIPPANQPGAKPPTVQEQEQKLIDDQDKLTNDAVNAERKRAAAVKAQQIVAQEQAGKEAEIAQAHAQRQQQITDAANARTQQWLDQTQQKNDQYMRMGLHGYFDDKSMFTKVLAGLSIAVGGLAGPNGNPGLKIIDNAIERDFRVQQGNIAKAKSNVEMAREGVQSSISQKQQDLADNNLKKAAAYDAVAAQAVANKLKQGVSLEDAQSDANVVSLRQKANAVRAETLKAVHAQNLQDAQLGQGEERIGIEREQLKIAQERAKNDELRAQAYAAKMGRHKGGGGGGGGGGGVDSAVVTLRKEMQDAVDAGKPMSGDQVTARAVQLGIPLKAKGGHVSLDTVQTQIAREGGLKARNERQESKDAEAWAKENGVQAIAKKQTELSSVLDEIKNAPHNPLQQALAIEKAVSSARGGAASRQALDLALKHLGGRWDSIEAFIQAGKDGQIGQKQMDNFVGFMTNQLGTAQKEGKDKYDAFDKYIASQPAEKQKALEAQRGRIFSGLAGFGGSSGGGKALPGGNKIVTKRNKKTGQLADFVERPDGTLVPVAQ